MSLGSMSSGLPDLSRRSFACSSGSDDFCCQPLGGPVNVELIDINGMPARTASIVVRLILASHAL